MFSYWEQQSLLQYDHIIIGAGIVGLHTAIELKELHPAASILVVERSLLPYGASTRNAGFACIGSLTELIDDLQHMSAEEMVDLVSRRQQGLALLRSRLGDSHIGYQEAGSHELLGQKELPALERMDELNELLKPINNGAPVFALANDKISTFGFPEEKVKALVANHAEGELHTGNMMWALKEYALHQGIEIKTGAEVHTIDQGEKPMIHLQDGFRTDSISLQCHQLFVCTNAFTPKLLPGYDIQPGRGQVLLTQPIPGLKIKGIFHFDAGYYYFRTLEGRILFGGGRHLDVEGEQSDQFVLNEQIQSQLERHLYELIVPRQRPQIAMRWSGIMAFGKTKRPIVTRVSPSVFGAFRMGGMGVALAAQVARELVQLSVDQ